MYVTCAHRLHTKRGIPTRGALSAIIAQLEQVKINKIKCDIFKICRQKSCGHAGENAAMLQSKVRWMGQPQPDESQYQVWSLSVQPYGQYDTGLQRRRPPRPRKIQQYAIMASLRSEYMYGRAQNNGRTSDNFRAYSLYVRPQLYLGGHYVQTYPITELHQPASILHHTLSSSCIVVESLHCTTTCQTTRLDFTWLATTASLHCQLQVVLTVYMYTTQSFFSFL